jgi:2-polyprenyl-3-methyl-5-hydroxy-6-metoxy-1,4-benzoquinol methylase
MNQNTSEEKNIEVSYENVEGNYFDKYNSKNPVVQKIMQGFMDTLTELAKKTGVKKIYEAGCGEGHLSLTLCKSGYEIRGSDIGEEAVEEAKSAAKQLGCDVQFDLKSIYDLDKNDSEDLIICCEVLEHVDDPERALKSLASVAKEYIILSVPREPVWRFLNLIRMKYIFSLGNTPGHIQHWSSGGFVKLVSKHFDIVEVRKPLPWTMILARVRK